jgi:hypothetical protein
MIAYSISVALAWLSLIYMVSIHASRIVEGKSLGVFGVAISVAGFCISLLFYLAGMRSKLRLYNHLAYWLPLILAMGLGMIFTVTFAP